MRRQPSLNFKPPKMAHGDADKMADQSETLGLPLVPWQRDFLNRIESASIAEQFGEIVAGVEVGARSEGFGRGIDEIDVEVVDE